MIQDVLISVFLLGVLVWSDLVPLRKKTFEWKGAWFAGVAYAFGFTVFLLYAFGVREGILFPMLTEAADSLKKLIGG
jgi:hypothetical protein